MDDLEANAPHPVDDITGPVNVRLYVRQMWTTDKVATRQAWPTKDGNINGRPIPQGYAHVSIDTILERKYNKIMIEHTISADKPYLGQHKGAHVAWLKRFIKLDHQASSGEEDDAAPHPDSG